MKKSFNFWNLFPWLLITLGVLLLIFRIWLNKRTNISEAEIVEEPTTDDEPTETDDEQTREQKIRNHFQIIRKTLDESKYSTEFIKMLTAVAMHETGVFSSNIYLENNNLFGMKLPTIRETRATGENRGHATFASLEDSVKDLELYLAEFDYKLNHTKIRDFVAEMKRNGYFTAPVTTYGNAVAKHYATVRSIIQ
jgi:hypothetical protein